jgi:hypothetical protein
MAVVSEAVIALPMKTLCRCLILILALGLVRKGLSEPKESPENAQAVADILDKMPSQKEFESALALERWVKIAPSEKELKEAWSTMDKVKAAIPRLLETLKVGASVFDYPGLLAHGKITYCAVDFHRNHPQGGQPVPSNHKRGETELGYELYFGWAPREQGTYPTDMAVYFDAKGVILSVEKVGWGY